MLSNAPGSSAPRNRLILWISIPLAGLLLYFSLRGLDWSLFLNTVRAADYRLLPLVFLWGSISSWVRAVRWRVLLTAETDISVRNVFWANMAGYLGNNVLPSRAGELIRALYVSSENRIPTSFALATGLVERFIDLLALILLGSASLAYADILSGAMHSALQVLSVIAFTGILAILIAPFFGSRVLIFVSNIPALGSPTGEKLLLFLEQFLHGIKALHNFKRLALLGLYTSIIWLMDGLGAVLVAHSIHLDLLLSQAFVLLSGLGLSSAIPSTPGYIGVYQFVAIQVLEPFSIARSSALAFILFLQIINLIIIAVWGGIALSRVSKLSRSSTSS